MHLRPRALTVISGAAVIGIALWLKFGLDAFAGRPDHASSVQDFIALTVIGGFVLSLVLAVALFIDLRAHRWRRRRRGEECIVVLFTDVVQASGTPADLPRLLE